MGEVDLIDWPEERTLVVAGPPAALKIPFSLRNRSLEPIRLHEASLADMRLAGGGASFASPPSHWGSTCRAKAPPADRCGCAWIRRRRPGGMKAGSGWGMSVVL